MNNIKLAFQLIYEALIGGIIILTGAFVVLSVLYLPIYGLGSVLISLYFWGYIVFLAPIGMLIGIFVAFLSMKTDSSKGKGRTTWLSHVISVVIPLIAFITIIFLPLIVGGAW